MPETYDVIKTLVIGLGSTGTEICDAVLRRIELEIQDISRAPWVRFLCIETNANQSTELRRAGDFHLVDISGTDYEDLLRHPEAFDEKIKLSEWADVKTLAELPGHDASAGAGNIRMVGRLAFLHEKNYSKIRQEVQKRIDWLRGLTEAQATAQRGPLSDESNPPVVFAAGGRVRVMVVGTLVGGTSSGLASDFGFLLKTLLDENEKVIGIFSIPRRDLTHAISARAERFKRNAYHALIELNHYHLAGRDGENRIRFSDGLEPNPSVAPYDLPYLVMPRRPDSEGTRELSQAVADRVFLNVFVPQTDPFARAIDVPTYRDREDRAHVFCTFGLSTLEFPAHRIMEACTKRLLAHTLRQWQTRSLPDDQLDSRLSDIGLTWASLRDLLLQLPNNESLLYRFNQKQGEVASLARGSVRTAEQSLEQLRFAFMADVGTDRATTLPRGIVPATVRTNRTSVARQVYDRLGDDTRTRLLDYFDGPAPLRQLLKKAQERLGELGKARSYTYHEESNRVDTLLARIRSYQNSPLLKFLFLRRPAITGLESALREALEKEVQARLNAEIYRALQNSAIGNVPEPGIVERLRRVLKPVEQRVNNLVDRVTAVINQLNQDADKLAKTEPDISGRLIFDRETAAGGTVREEYERCLTEESEQPGDDWRSIRERLAADTVRVWTNLPDSVLPPPTLRMDEDWLIKDFNPNRDDDPIPVTDKEKLERTARKPFLRLAQVDVLARWRGTGVSETVRIQQAREIAEKAQTFLRVAKALAERGGRSPIDTRRTIMVPASRYHAEFANAIDPVLRGDVARATSPDPFRAVLLEEWYRFPLTGAPDILGVDGIHKAICTDFPTFHTRRDVFWTGLSDEEVQAVKEARELAVVGVLLQTLKPAGGALTLRWPSKVVGDEPDRRLPLSIRGTAKYLAREENDLDGNSLRGARRILSQQVDELRMKSIGNNDKERNKTFIQVLVERLQSGAGAGVRDWDMREVKRNLRMYLFSRRELRDAYLELHRPQDAAIAQLRRSKGDPRPLGGVFEENGLYCPKCGGLIGKDDMDAAQNGWQCFVDPSHDIGLGPFLDDF